MIFYNNSLKIPKGSSEAVNWKDRQHTGQTKRTKGQTMIYKTLHRS